ncbi:small acid-soluble spore protein H [Anoxybacillus flavithermus TNO-09.006]|nr:small acid-soluble spore protein H [Anoxybacillus flavithermus TNO-09.006]
MKLDINRIKQIVSSPDDIRVCYHGQSVWIDGYDEANRTATVHMRGREHERHTVPVEELTEE